MQRPPQRIRSLPPSAQPKLAEGATQFARAMGELGIRQIFAGSAQAKGRVERAAGTFQDRLVTELRLDGASTLVGANYRWGRSWSATTASAVSAQPDRLPPA